LLTIQAKADGDLKWVNRILVVQILLTAPDSDRVIWMRLGSVNYLPLLNFSHIIDHEGNLIVKYLRIYTKEKNMRKRLFLSIFTIEVIIGGLALAYIASAYWHKPLGPSLAMANQASVSLEKPTGNALNEDILGSLPQPTPTSPSILAQIASLFKSSDESSKPLCGGPSVMTLLVIGSDERGNDYLYGLADSIRIVRVDFTLPGVMVLDIPRDLWVDIPGISDHYGIAQGKLNQAYFFGNPGMGYYDGPGEGPGLLARTLDQNYGLKVDHYLALDRATFVEAINSIGGVDVQLSSLADMNQGQDGANPSLVLESGYHHLDGDMALKLAINRYPSTFQRARYQNIVLKSLQAKLITPSMLPELPRLISQFTGSVQTDLSPSDINQLICMAKALTGENTKFVAFPDEMFVSGSTYDPYRLVNTFTLSVDMDLFREYIADFMNGTWPTDQG
jgi:LCP family protein required for cell wall assembly